MDPANQKKYLYKIQGQDKASGRAAWWIVRIFPEKLAIFSAIIDKGHIDMANYGEVLVSGFGDIIPEAVLQQYGFED